MARSVSPNVIHPRGLVAALATAPYLNCRDFVPSSSLDGSGGYSGEQAALPEREVKIV